MEPAVAGALIAGIVALAATIFGAIASRRSAAVVELEAAMKWQAGEILELRAENKALRSESNELRADLKQANAHIDEMAEQLAELRKDPR